MVGVGTWRCSGFHTFLGSEKHHVSTIKEIWKGVRTNTGTDLERGTIGYGSGQGES